MGTKTMAPIGVGGIRTMETVETSGNIAPIAESTPAGLRTMAPITTTPYRPPVNNTGSFQQNLKDTQLDPAYFDNLDRVNEIALVEEMNDTGIDELSGISSARQQPEKRSFFDPINQMNMATFESAQNIEQNSEVLGLVEIGVKMLINFFGEGFTSAGALLTSANPLYYGIQGQNDKTFAEKYISNQGAIAAAHGRFYDYAPLIETTNKDMEALATFMQGTIGASSQFLGNETLEATGSPFLAVGAALIPDAILMALPFAPKAVRAMRESRAVAAFDAELDAALQTAAQREGLSIQRSTAMDEVGEVSTLRVFDENSGQAVGEQIARRRGENLQIVSSQIDESLRGRGVGRQMYETTIDHAAANGYASVISDTQLSQAAVNVFEAIRQNGKFRVEKLPNSNIITEVDGADVTQYVSTTGAPIYKVILDEPAATSTLTSMRMKVETINALRGGAPPAGSALVADLATQLKSGKAAGDIIVETVEGTPVKVLSGAENLDALVLATERAGLRMRTVDVKLQERVNPTAGDVEALGQQARNGMADIVANQRKLELTEQAGNRSIVQKLVHLFADTSGNVKSAILRSMGEAGMAAVRDFSLKAGAVPKAHMMFQDFHRAVYGSRAPTDPGLSFRRSVNHLDQTVSEVDLFNILVQSRRIQAIIKSGGARSTAEGFQLTGAVKPENAAGNIWAIRQTLGETRFAQLQARADATFEVMHQQLIRLRENGIITQRQLMRMQNIDYIRREFIEGIDPIMLQSQLRGSKVSIGESGIYHLKGGSSRAQNLDVQSLVAEYLARTEGRIFRNNANRSLRQAAIDNPDNGLVTIPKSPGTKTPEGMTELKVMIDGKAERMFMKDLYAAEWIVNDPGINATIANIFRIINGTFVVKPLATGMNPAFALVNFPRDIMHVWKASGNEYSAFLPRYLGQIFGDILEVRRDVWNKDGLYREYIEDGGGMNFLTHGGFDPFTGFNKSKDLMRTMGVYQGSLGRFWGQAKEILSKVNEFSELAVRLAVRQRVLKNQAARGEMPDRRTATFVAREYLDFSQGGSATKAIESWFPYSNAAAQAIRTSMRAYTQGGRGAAVAALKDMQVVTMKAMQSSWAWMEHPEVMAQVDPHTAYTTQVYPTGLYFTDNNGNQRNVFISVAMDTTTVPFTALFDRAISKHALLATGIDPNDIPSDHFLSEIASIVPILSQIRTGTPTFQAAAALWSNKDIWANRDIWTGDPNVMPGARRTEGTAGTMFDVLGQAAPEVVSPVQLQKAWRTYVPSNFYLDSADFIRKQVQQSNDPVAYAEMVQRGTSNVTLELIAQVPGLNRLIHLTHPAAQTTPELRMLSQNVATWREIERQAIDAAVRKHLVLGDSSDFTKLIESVAAVRPQDAERMKDLFITGVAVDSMYKDNEYDIGFVGEDWFNLLAGQNAETRAELFYWKQVSLSDENAANLQAVVAKIDEVGGRRIWTDEFQQHFAQLISQYGTREERLRAVMGSAN